MLILTLPTSLSSGGPLHSGRKSWLGIGEVGKGERVREGSGEPCKTWSTSLCGWLDGLGVGGEVRNKG